MSNVIGFKAFKNTLKRDSGYAPVSGENGYSVIRCVFPAGGDWDNISAVSAGFFVHPKNIAGVTAAITDDGEERAALFTIPGALLKQGERLHFGLFATVGGVTIATNTVALDVERGIVSDDIDYDPAEAAGMFEQFSNALNTALLGKADKVTGGNVSGKVLTADSNGNIQSSGYSVDSVSLGAGIPTSPVVQQALNGKANAADTLTGYGITDAYTKEQTDELIAGKADKLVNGDVAFTDRILIASNNGGIKNSGYTINNARLSGDVNLTVPSSNVVAIALEGKADKAAAGTNGELAAFNGNGALIRSGVSVAQSVGEGSTDEVPTTAAVRNALDGKADKLVNGDVAFTDRILIASNNGGIKNSGYTINNARLSGDVNLTVPSSNVVAIALEGKADKLSGGGGGELVSATGGGEIQRSGLFVAQSIGEGSNSKVPTTAAVKTALDGAAAEAAVTGAAINSISLNRSSQSIALSTGSIIDEQSLITGLSIPYGTKIYVKLGFSASSNPVVTGKAVQIRANGKFIASLNRGAVNNWTEVTLSGQLTSGEIITRLGVYLANDVLSTQTDFILSVRSSIIKSINDNADNISEINAVLQPLGETVNGHLLDYEILPTSNAPTFSGNTSHNDPLIVTLPYFYIRNKSAFGTAYTTRTPSNSPFSVGHNEGLFYNLETKNLEVLSVANTPLDTKYILLLWKQITAVKGLWAYVYYDSVLKQAVEGRPSANLDDGAVTTVKLADGAVTSAKIVSGEVKTANLDDGAVTTAKLADGAVTSAKIGSGEVKTANLDDGAVTTVKLADGAVTSAKIGSGEVKTANLDDGAVTTAKLASSAVTSEKLASGAVTLSKLDSGVIDKNLGTQGAAAEAAVTGAAINSISLNRSSQSITLSTGSIIDEQSLITGLSIPYGTKIYVKLGFSASSNPVVTGKAVQIRANGKFITSLNRGAVNNWTEVTLSGQLTSGEIITRLGVYLANNALSTQTDFILSVRSSIMQAVEGRLSDSSGAVKTANLDDGAVTNDKLSEDLSAQIQQISSCKHYTKKIISRQGQGYGYPDNSLEGITAALKDGYRNIRLSVASTGDNVIYCTHSYELSHNTDYQTPVITQNGQPYTQNVVINDVTSEFIDSILYKGYAIPTLDEALKVISLYDADVTLEVKDDFSVTAIQNIIDAIKFYSINITLSGLPQQVEPFANVYGGLNLGLIFNYSVNAAATYKARFEGKYKTVRFDCFFTDTITTADIINNIHPDVKLKLGGSYITAAQAKEYMAYLDATEYQGKVSDIY